MMVMAALYRVASARDGQRQADDASLVDDLGDVRQVRQRERALLAPPP